MTAQSPPPQDAGVSRARPLELFFDLVFVFAVTQLSAMVAHPHGGLDYLQAALIFLSLMWMYDGYVWLSSNLGFDTDAQSWMFFAAMATFLAMAVGIADIRGSGGVLFGLGLLLVTAIHLVMFRRVPNSSGHAIAHIAPFNLASALLVLFAAFAPGAWHWALWGLAIAVLAFSTVLRREGQFSLSPLHFAERHGLLFIITLGESVMALGVGARGQRIDAPLLAYLFLGLLLAAHLWWSYFGPGGERAEHQFVGAAPGARNRMALVGYGYLHMLMMAGIILIAAALDAGIRDPTHRAGVAGAWNLAAGLALFYTADVLFQRVMAAGRGKVRLLLAAVLLCSMPIGVQFGALWQLLACTVVVVLTILVEDYVLPEQPVAGGH